MGESSPVDRRLAELASATEALRPKPGFSAAVMAAVQAAHPSHWFDGLWRPGRVVVAIGAIAAAASALMAVSARDALEEQVLTAFEVVEEDDE